MTSEHPDAPQIPHAAMILDAARPCRRVGASELAPADPTPGMTREVALQTEGMWSGTVDTEAGATSGWHHHGTHDTTLYVVAGTM
ncbi:MAG: hypothetical protein ABI243_06305, partial [Lapillicoccus sp.]